MVQRAATLLHVALRDFTRNDCHYVAAGIAYWALFSLFPLALAAISIFSFIYTTPEEQAPLIEGIVRLIPVSEDYLVDLIGDVVKARGTLGLVAGPERPSMASREPQSSALFPRPRYVERFIVS